MKPGNIVKVGPRSPVCVQILNVATQTLTENIKLIDQINLGETPGLFTEIGQGISLMTHPTQFKLRYKLKSGFYTYSLPNEKCRFFTY